MMACENGKGAEGKGGRGEGAVSDPQKERGRGKNRMEAEKDEEAVEDRQGCATDRSFDQSLERSMNGGSNEDGDKVKARDGEEK